MYCVFIKMNDVNIQKPILKWVGGKTQLMNNILSKMPKEINNYHEPFVGGGSVLLGVLSLKQQQKINIKGNIYAYDLNPALINLFKHIQNNKDELYKILTDYKEQYNKINTLKSETKNNKDISDEQALKSKEQYYYWVRNKFNKLDKSTLEYSALLIFLNKTCYRGLYREGPNGFNVPFGHYKTNIAFVSIDDLNNIYSLIKDVKFICSSFEISLKKIKKNDFVYLDPPYYPEIKTSFVNYTNNGFNIDDHNSLFNQILSLNEKNVKFMLSNSNVEEVVKFFENFEIIIVNARRAINSKKPNSTTTEVIIKNY
jgi:DNA adenine methylase